MAARPSTRGAARAAQAKQSALLTGFWTAREKEQFEHGIATHGWSNWKALGPLIPTRTSAQIKSHAQKFRKNRPDQLRALVKAHEAKKKERGRSKTRKATPARGRGKRATPARRGHSVPGAKKAAPARGRSATPAARTKPALRDADAAAAVGGPAKKEAKPAKKKEAATPAPAPNTLEATRKSLRLQLKPRRLRSASADVAKSAERPAAVPSPAETPKRKKKVAGGASRAEEAASPSKKAKEAPAQPEQLEQQPPSGPRRVSLPSAGRGEDRPHPHLDGVMEKGVDQGLDEFLWNLPDSLPGSPVATRPLLPEAPRSPRRVSFASEAPPLPITPFPAPAPAPPVTPTMLAAFDAAGLDEAGGADELMGPALQSVPLKGSANLALTPKMWTKGDGGDGGEVGELDALDELAAAVSPTGTPVPWPEEASQRVLATPVNKARTFEAMLHLKAQARAGAVTPSPAAGGLLEDEAEGGHALEGLEGKLGGGEARSEGIPFLLIDEEAIPFDEASVASPTKSEEQIDDVVVTLGGLGIGKEGAEATADYLDPDWGLTLEAILPNTADSKVEDVVPTLAPKVDVAPTLESPPASKAPLLALANAAEAAPSLATIPLEARPDPKMFRDIRTQLLEAPDYNNPSEYVLGADGLSRRPKEKGVLCRIRIKGLLTEHLDSQWWRDDSLDGATATGGGDEEEAVVDKVAPRKLELEHLVALTAVMLDLDLWHRAQADEDDVLQVGHLASGLWLRVIYALRKDGFALLQGADGSSPASKRKLAIDRMVGELESISRGEAKGTPTPRASLYDRE